VACGWRLLRQSLGEHGQQLFVVPGLDHKIKGPFLERADGQVDVAVGRDHHHGGLRPEGLYFPEPVKPFIAGVQGALEVHVQQNDGEVLLAEQGRDIFGVLFRDDLPDLGPEQQAHGREHIGVIVHHQDGGIL
jgi:hypothetical protein